MIGALFRTVVAQNSSQSNNEAGTFVAWIIAFVLAAIVLAFIIRPLLVAEPVSQKPKSRVPNASNTELESFQEQLVVEKTSLEELEYDYEFKALAAEDYNDLKQQLTTRIAALEVDIQEREALISEQNRERQRRVAARREARQVKATTKPDTSTAEVTTPNEIRAKTAVKQDLKCSECGTPAKPNDRFCSQCGAPLNEG